MKYLASCSPSDPSATERFDALIPDEAEALRRLRAQGILHEAWSPGKPGALLVLEAGSEAEAERIVAGLPLAVAGLLDTVLTPLHDLGV